MGVLFVLAFNSLKVETQNLVVLVYEPCLKRKVTPYVIAYYPSIGTSL